MAFDEQVSGHNTLATHRADLFKYPNKPPNVKFISKMFHPNVYGNGDLCLDILQNRWSPTYDVAAILTSIQSLLNDPNNASPANAEAANLHRDNLREYVKRVRYVTCRCIMVSDSFSGKPSNRAGSATSYYIVVGFRQALYKWTSTNR